MQLSVQVELAIVRVIESEARNEESVDALFEHVENRCQRVGVQSTCIVLRARIRGRIRVVDQARVYVVHRANVLAR